MQLRLLSAEDVRTVLPMSVAIDAMHEAFRVLAWGEVDVPPRTHLELPHEHGSALFMPAATREPVRVGSKMLTVCAANHDRGLPLVHGVMVMFNTDTGEPDGLLECTTLTALRTGAASGLATALLARSDVSRVAIIGSGAQARTQLEAVCCVRHIEEASVFSRSRDHAEAFAREMGGRPNIPASISVARSAEEAADGAGVICTATTATRPVLGLADLSTGAHVNAIGSHTPEMREIAPGVVHRATVVVDDRNAALAEAGDLIACVNDGSLDPEELIELGEVVTGTQPGRTDNEQVTVFKSVGLAIQDLCAAAAALERASRDGVGTMVELS
jgi:ornithine cyclodeaminase/alanine dehydrogenase-like protein (mu-crystallin family)